MDINEIAEEIYAYIEKTAEMGLIRGMTEIAENYLRAKKEARGDRHALLKEAAISLRPFLDGFARLGKNFAKGTGNQTKRLYKFTRESAKKLPETPLKPENPLSPGSAKPFNTLADEINSPQFNASGTQTHGLYSGISGNPGNAAVLRGLAGFTLGNSFNPYTIESTDGTTDGLTWFEKQRKAWKDPRSWATPLIGALVAAGVRPGVAAKFLSKYSLNGAPVDQRIVSNIISQPIVRLGATAALGDMAEIANSHMGVPWLDGKLKPAFMAVGGLSGLRPLAQLLQHKSRLARTGVQKLPTLAPTLTKLINHNMLTGANAAKRPGFIPSLLAAGGINLAVIPYARSRTENLQKLIDQSVNAYGQQPPAENPEGNNPFHLRFLDWDRKLNEANKASGNWGSSPPLPFLNLPVPTPVDSDPHDNK
jgi:hypothetical protein